MKAIRIFSGLALTLALAACTEKEIYYVYPEYEEESTEITGSAAVSSSNPYFTVTDDGYAVNYKTRGGEITIQVDYAFDWTVTNDGEDWLTADWSCEYGTLTLTASQNTVDAQNTATVTLLNAVSGNAFATIRVTQNAYGTPEIYSDLDEWNFPAVGALSAEIAVTTTLDDWSVESACTWLLVEKTDNSVILTADANEETEARVTQITLVSTNGTDSDTQVIAVSQDAKAYVTLSAETLTFYGNTEAKTPSATVVSNYDWDITYDTANGWFTATKDGDTITAAVSSENTADNNREGTITVTASDGAENVAEIKLSVIQLGSASSSMVLALAPTSSQLTATLPISGTVNCTVDWGDGTTETVTAEYPSHSYTEAGNYLVTITGTVTALNSNGSAMTNNTRKLITEVVQWGDTGLTDLSNAFYACSALTSIAPDTAGAFAKVTSAYQAFSGSILYDMAITEIPEGLFDYAVNCESFESVFKYCTKLASIPEGLFDNCTAATSFRAAFYNCKALTEIPSGLFAGLTAAEDFYQVFYSATGCASIPEDLFEGCTSVTTMEQAFYGCTGLTNVPAGLFDDLSANKSFASIFRGCTKLQYIPEGLFAGSPLCETVYYCLYGCSALTEIPSGIFAGLTACTTFEGAFYNCSALTTVPADLLADASSATTVAYLFYGCKALTSVPAGLFSGLTSCTSLASLFYGSGIAELSSDTFEGCSAVTNINNIFYNCTGLTTLPESLFAPLPSVTTIEAAFRGCTGLTSIPADLFASLSGLTSLTQIFNGCTALTQIPEGLFDSNTALTTATYLFVGCTGLTAVPGGLFKNNTAVSSFNYVFQNCSGLTSVPDDIFNTTAEATFTYAFTGCSKLTDVPESLFASCPNASSFSGLFASCTSLESVPGDIFKNNTAVTTMSYVFDGCSKLTTVPEGLFTANTKNENFSYVFRNCSSLTSVPGGIFAGNTKASNFSYVFYGSGIKELSGSLFAANTEATNFSYAFYNCTGLTSLPAALFDSCTKVTTFNYAFYGCTGLGGESPYATITVDGSDVTVHLYERQNYTDYFTKPTGTRCFYNCTGLSDVDAITSASWN